MNPAEQISVDDNRLFQSVVESITSAVFVFQGEKVRYVNAAAQSISGYSEHELLAMPFWAVVHEDSRELVKQRGFSRQAGEAVPASYQIKIVRKDGETRWANFRANLIVLNGKPAVLGIGDDITERKQSEEAFQLMIKSIVASTGQDFFDVVASSLCEWLDADCAIISEIVRKGRVEALGMQLDGKSIAEFGYDLTGSPCDNAIARGYAVYPENLCETFPDDKEVVEMQAEGYVGVALKDKGGEPIGVLCVLSRRKFDLPAKTKEVLEIIATKAAVEIERRQVVKKEGLLGQRFASQQTAMMQLLTATPQTLEAALQEICEVSAKTLAVERVSIWLFSEDRKELRCLNLFSLGEAKHSSGTVLQSNDYPHYFAALTFDRAIEAEDARSDPHTCEFTENYLIPLGITSMLDMPIRLEGKMVGVVCHEHTGAIRKWAADEFGFACEVADLVTQAMLDEKRNQAELARLRSEAKHRIIFEASTDAIMVLDENTFLDCNYATMKVFGCKSREDFLNKHPSDFSPKTQPCGADSMSLANKHIATAFKDGCDQFEWTHMRLDGTEFIANVLLTAMDMGGKPVLQATVRDITELKNAEILIKRTAEILEMVATGQPASNIYDAIAHMYEARHPGMRCSMLKLKGDKLMHGGAPSLPEEYCNAVNGLQNGPNVGSCGTSTYTGKRVLVEDIATDPKWADLKSVALPHGLRSCWSEPIKSAAGKVLGAFGMYYNHPALPNENERVDLESAARLTGIVMGREQRDEALRKLSSAIEQAGESILITDREGVIEYVNPAFTASNGYTAEEVIGQKPSILKSGDQDDAFYENMWKTITAGETWTGKVIDRKKDGSFYPAMLTISPIFNESGESYTHFVGIHADLSELADMQQQFQQAQKMEAIGTLVGGIAHDFNNMLAGITGNLYLLKTMETNPEAMGKLDNIEQLSFRSAEMIKQLLAFARKDRVVIKPLSFTAFSEETLRFLRTTVPENIEMSQDICADDLQINGDATQLHQVLMNLIGNARDALDGVQAARISIRLNVFQPDDAFVAGHSYFKAGQYAHLSIKDNGHGIPEHQIEHLFEPFFTTKEQGRGTGLGLAMVFGAIKTHLGFIDVESVEGEGATFHIYIPLLEQEASVCSSPGADEVIDGQGELILLVDDEQHVRETTAEVLEAIGYKVLLATDGLQAIEVFKAHQDEISLAILDVVMPRCGGVQLAESIRAIEPDMPIIFATGYDKEHVLDSDKPIKNSEILSKPFQFDILSRIIHGKLNS